MAQEVVEARQGTFVQKQQQLFFISLVGPPCPVCRMPRPLIHRHALSSAYPVRYLSFATYANVLDLSLTFASFPDAAFN